MATTKTSAKAKPSRSAASDRQRVASIENRIAQFTAGLTGRSGSGASKGNGHDLFGYATVAAPAIRIAHPGVSDDLDGLDGDLQLLMRAVTLLRAQLALGDIRDALEASGIPTVAIDQAIDQIRDLFDRTLDLVGAR